MTIFSQHARKTRVENTDATAGDTAATEGLTADATATATAESTDPLDAQPQPDAHAEQRNRLNAAHGMENLSAEGDINGTPVDGTDDNQTVPGTKTDVDLPDGEFGEDAAITNKPNGDTHVDADDTEATFKQEGDDEVDRDLDVIDADDLEIMQLEQTLHQLVDSAVAIESYGMNPTAMAIMQTTGLLNGTALESLGLESVTFSAGDDAESQMALESIMEQVKEKSAQWSAKIVSVVKNSGEKLMSVLEPLWTKISEVTKTLGSAVWDKAKAGTAVVRAHPMKTVAAVIAAIAAVGAIAVMVAGGAPAAGAKVDVIKAFASKLASDVSKIKWPFGTITAKVADSGMKVSATVSKGASAVKSATIDSLGWTASSVRAMGSQLDRAWTGVKHGWSALGNRATKLAHSSLSMAVDVVGSAITLNDHAANSATKTASRVFGKSAVGGVASRVVGSNVGGAAAGAYVMAVVGWVVLVFKLTRAVVVGGFRMILGTFRALTPHAEPAAA